MSFFKKLSDLIGDEYSVQLVIQQKGKKMSVSVVPHVLDKKSELSKQTMQPIVLSGYPEDIDMSIIPHLAEPIGAFNSMVVSGNSFVKEKPKPRAKKGEEKPKEEILAPEVVPKPIVEAPKPKAETEDTVDEDSGVVMPMAATLDDDDPPFEADAPTELNKTQETNPEAQSPTVSQDQGQGDMFDGDDW